MIELIIYTIYQTIITLIARFLSTMFSKK